LLAAGIADHDVESAETAHGVLDQLLAEFLIAKIAWNGQADAALGLDQGDDLVGVRLLVRVIIDRHVGALPGIGNGGGASHAGVAAGDEGLASLQTSRAAIAFLAVVGNGIHLAREAGPGLGLSRKRRDGILGFGIGEFFGGSGSHR
jgi:hypothetical protein